MPDNKITVEFKDGKKITKFPDGSVRENTPEDAQRYLDYLSKEKQRIERHIALVSDDINQMVASKKVK